MNASAEPFFKWATGSLSTAIRSPKATRNGPNRGVTPLWHGMAWHALVGCGCALSSLYHFGGHLPPKVHPSNFLCTYVLPRA